MPVRKPSTSGLRTAAARPAKDVLRETQIGNGVADLPAAAPKPRKRPKPVRITVDLSPEQYRALTEWTSTAAAELGVPRLTLADAIRAMAKVTAVDSSISAVVVDMIRRDKESASQ